MSRKNSIFSHAKSALCSQCLNPMKRLPAELGEDISFHCSPCESARNPIGPVSVDDIELWITAKEQTFIDKLFAQTI